MQGVSSIIPAAGFGKRMRGGDKLLEPVEGLPLLRRIVLAAQAVSDLVVVALPSDSGPRADALDGLTAVRIAVPDAALGMARSLVRAVGALPDTPTGILILPADMPEIDAGDLRRLADVFRDHQGRRIVQATSDDGQPGHPVIFPDDCRAALMALTGDRGARDVLRANLPRRVLVPLSGRRALVDLDTPEDWAQWRAGQAGSSAPD
ncbi:nucleotidyltransferase family protein [Roseivivax sp. CAU 1753]